MISLVFWSLAAASLLVAAFYLLHLLLFAPRSRATISRINRSEYPGVSILKPVKGMTALIESCVESFFALDYDQFELIFAVDEADDEAHHMIRRLQQTYPQVVCKVVVSGHSDQVNPKVHKLMAMENLACQEIFWVADANVRVDPDTLLHLIDEMRDQRVKLLFSPIRGCGSGSLGSLMENGYINSFLSGNVIAAWKLLTHPIIVGKSILLEREALNQFGGFVFFRNFLAEDYVMGDSYKRCGVPMGMSRTWIDNVNQDTTVQAFVNRLQRWAQLRFHLKTHVYLLEPAANPLFYALAAYVSGGFQNSLWLLAVLSLKILLELWGFHRLDGWGERRGRQICLFPLAVLIKDVLMVWIFIAPFFKHTVRWSGGPIRIGAGTRINGIEMRMYDGV